MKEKITIELDRYRDKDGKATCATNFETGYVCQFYRTTTFGLREHCVFDMNYMLERRNYEGTLIPGKSCLVFKSEEICP